MMQGWLFQRALASERKRTGLRRQVHELSFGPVVSYERAAEAGQEVVVLLHGACADHSSWLRFARALGPGPRLLVPDLPGHGESAAPLGVDYGITAQAGRVLEWLAALGVTRAHWVGSSMGGALALQLAHQRPSLVASLILIGSAGAESRPSELRAHVAAGHAHPMIEVDTLDDYRGMLRWGMVKPPWLPTFVMRLLLAQKRQRRALERQLLADLERDQDQRPILTGIRAPSLILWGRRDRVLHVDDAQALHRALAGSQLRIYEDLGHVPMVEQPMLLAGHCREFWAGCHG